VQRGEIVALVGPSGCGKSTLLRMIARLIAPTSGAIWVAPDLGGESGRIGFVFQQPTLMPWASVQANVRLPHDLAGIPKRDAGPQVERALALVGLEDFRTYYPHQLSGGMQMRVSIARTLVTGPRLLLMDEPFGALDEMTRNRLDTDVSRLAAREKLTVLFVTHSIYEAVFLADRVLVMSPRPGSIVQEVRVGAPHPREDDFRLSEQFARLCAQLSRGLAIAAEGVA
jgi:NitT/TauT family transport system ATP-binding protein